MKNLVFPLLAALLLAACQNSTTTPAATPSADAPSLPAELVISPEQITEANAKVKISLQAMQNLTDELNAASVTISAAKKTELDNIRAGLGDLMTKQKMMADGIEAAAKGINAPTEDAAGTTVPTPGVLKDYIESVGRYDSAIDELKGLYEALKNKK